MMFNNEQTHAMLAWLAVTNFLIQQVAVRVRPGSWYPNAEGDRSSNAAAQDRKWYSRSQFKIPSLSTGFSSLLILDDHLLAT
jgi:hypothetical protein